MTIQFALNLVQHASRDIYAGHLGPAPSCLNGLISRPRSQKQNAVARLDPLQLIAFDLADGDTIQVERVFELPGCEHVKRTVPITSCCGTCTQSVYRQGTRLVDTTWIQAEGRYRLVYSSGTVGTATVIMHEDPLAIHRDLDDCDSCECAVDLCSLISEQPDVGQAALGLD